MSSHTKVDTPNKYLPQRFVAVCLGLSLQKCRRGDLPQRRSDGRTRHCDKSLRHIGAKSRSLAATSQLVCPAAASRLLALINNFIKLVLRPKKQFSFFLDFKSMLTKYQLTQVLSSDFKKTPVYFDWNFLFYWSAITNFKILRELGRGENDVKDALV